MGLFIKKNHGTEYLYSIAGEKQFFLGRKDDPDNVNQENLKKAMTIIDENFDRQLEKYIIDLEKHTSYMMKNSGRPYINKRKNTLLLKIRRVK